MPPIPASTSTPPLSPAGCRPATCPRCGTAFDCGATLPAATPCACAGVGLTPAQRSSLRDRYEGCLCVACLQAIARGEAADVTVGATEAVAPAEAMTPAKGMADPAALAAPEIAR